MSKMFTQSFSRNVPPLSTSPQVAARTFAEPAAIASAARPTSAFFHPVFIRIFSMSFLTVDCFTRRAAQCPVDVTVQVTPGTFVPFARTGSVTEQLVMRDCGKQALSPGQHPAGVPTMIPGGYVSSGPGKVQTVGLSLKGGVGIAQSMTCWVRLQ